MPKVDIKVRMSERLIKQALKTMGLEEEFYADKEVTVFSHISIVKRFLGKNQAAEYADKVEKALKIAGIKENDIWTNIEQIYETRYDCCTARLAAAA